ncbi:hypothetical protein AN641_07535 [Candidatus Epulonipiscioides gigas]|nr:hypothetical protein AN641_07535 [Epulopiscium sp. SCG-C07WGA-EpuloA2]
MKIFYFTATGNNLYIAKSISENLYSIPQILKNQTLNFTDEKIGIIFPIYAMSISPYIQDFLKKVTFNYDYLFAIMTYGIYDGATPNHLLDIAKETGLNFSYINTIKMVDNWLPGFNMEKQIKNEHKKQIEKHLDAIKSDIEHSKHAILKSSMLDKLATNHILKQTQKSSPKETLHGTVIGSGIKNFINVENICTKCGVCMRVCPVNNIEIKDKNHKISLDNKCISCFACIHNCPSNAIHIEGEKSKARYRNSHINLQDIIKANNQL